MKTQVNILKISAFPKTLSSPKNMREYGFSLTYILRYKDGIVDWDFVPDPIWWVYINSYGSNQFSLCENCECLLWTFVFQSLEYFDTLR